MADTLLIMQQLNFDSAVRDIESYVNVLQSELASIEASVKARRPHLNEHVLHNNQGLERAIVKYNMLMDLLPGLQRLTEVESEHGQQARDERGNAGGDAGDAGRAAAAPTRARRKPRDRG